VDESLHADIARIALLLSDQDLRQKLREATSSAELYATIIGSDPPVQAAEVQAVQTS
jgi:mannitol/fructose-specific phosphotransferase system IIA component (Ntr-type)